MGRRRGSASGSAPAGATPIAPTLRRYARPAIVGRRQNAVNRAGRWASFRAVVRAVRTLLFLGLPVTSRSVERATEVMAGIVPHVVRVPAKTVLENDMCACVLAAWTTAKAKPRRKAKAKVHIPRAWRDLSRIELMELAAGYRDRLAESERVRKLATAAQAAVAPKADTLTERLAALARVAAEEAAARATGGELRGRPEMSISR